MRDNVFANRSVLAYPQLARVELRLAGVVVMPLHPAHLLENTCTLDMSAPSAPCRGPAAFTPPTAVSFEGDAYAVHGVHLTRGEALALIINSHGVGFGLPRIDEQIAYLTSATRAPQGT